MTNYTISEYPTIGYTSHPCSGKCVCVCVCAFKRYFKIDTTHALNYNKQIKNVMLCV